MSHHEKPVFIVSATRTPIGSYLGALSTLSAPALGATAISAALERGKVAADQVDEVYMGNVLSAGIGQAPARQASKAAGIPDAVPCTTVSKVCGSGLQSVFLATRALKLGDIQARHCRRHGVDVERSLLPRQGAHRLPHG